MYGVHAALLRDVLWADPTDSDAMPGGIEEALGHICEAVFLTGKI